MQKIKTIAILTVALVLSACASTQRLSEADRASTKTVAISSTVQKGDLFLLAPGGANIGLMFGALGGAAASGSLANERTAFDSFLQANAVSIDAIVRDEFEKVLRASGKVAIAAPGDAALPVLKISVPQYGFGVTHLMSSNVVPVMNIKGVLTDGAGKVLWSDTESMLPSIASPMESTTWQRLHDDPKQIEQEWRKAAHYLAKKIVDTL
ncbi:hypothetical protein NHH82_20885 [Oxalobacteraceae bacterium OTU3REALA1]|nr:hypothetical protein NHH82_20885 [Oxalobacteraceae bacterium OTU3REALA1]